MTLLSFACLGATNPNHVVFLQCSVKRMTYQCLMPQLSTITAWHCMAWRFPLQPLPSHLDLMPSTPYSQLYKGPIPSDLLFAWKVHQAPSPNSKFPFQCCWLFQTWLHTDAAQAHVYLFLWNFLVQCQNWRFNSKQASLLNRSQLLLPWPTNCTPTITNAMKFAQALVVLGLCHYPQHISSPTPSTYYQVDRKFTWPCTLFLMCRHLFLH